MASLVGGAGEFGVLRKLLRLLPPGAGVLVGAGDDCAVLRGESRLLLTTDALVEGVHFRREWQSPRALGRKAVLASLSDIAAMGGRPRYCVLSVGLPADYRLANATELQRGSALAAKEAGAAIVGGNVSAAPCLFISVTAVGTPSARPALRRGARPGDHVFVTGTLGDAALGLQLLRSGLRRGSAYRKLIRRFLSPSPRFAAGVRLTRERVVSAMIDVSDGLLQDLGHICARSHVGAVVLEPLVPRSAAYVAVAGEDAAPALTGGEDYELLFTVPPRRLPLLEGLRPRLACPVSLVGRIVERPLGVRVRDAGGRTRRPLERGFDHFRVA